MPLVVNCAEIEHHFLLFDQTCYYSVFCKDAEKLPPFKLNDVLVVNINNHKQIINQE